MAEVKWYSLTPGRRMLLSALGVALVVFLLMMSRCTRVLQPLKDFDGEESPKNNPVR